MPNRVIIAAAAGLFAEVDRRVCPDRRPHEGMATMSTTNNSSTSTGRTTIDTAVRRVAVGVTALLLVACADAAGGLATVPTVAPLATVPVTEPAPTDPPTTVAPTTTDDGVGPEATDPPGITTLGDGPWHRVDGAPGIDTPGLFYELMPGLTAYLPVVEDIERGVLWTLRERDREIIEAYLQARLVYYRAVTQDPIDLDDEGWDYWYIGEGGSWYLDALRDWRATGKYADLDQGVVMRPQVVGDDRTDDTALVYECLFDGAVAFNADGSLIDGASYGVAKKGYAYAMLRVDGIWRLSGVFSADMACIV